MVNFPCCGKQHPLHCAEIWPSPTRNVRRGLKPGTREWNKKGEPLHREIKFKCTSLSQKWLAGPFFPHLTNVTFQSGFPRSQSLLCVRIYIRIRIPVPVPNLSVFVCVPAPGLRFGWYSSWVAPMQKFTRSDGHIMMGCPPSGVWNLNKKPFTGSNRSSGIWVEIKSALKMALHQSNYSGGGGLFGDCQQDRIRTILLMMMTMLLLVLGCDRGQPGYFKHPEMTFWFPPVTVIVITP